MNTRRSGPDLRTEKFATVLFFLFAFGFFVYLFRYYMTGIGGPTLIAVTLVPITFIVFTLGDLKENNLYPRLGPVANWIIAGIFILVCLAVTFYFNREFMDVRTVRAGFWNKTDLTMGCLMFLLVMEYARRRYLPLFVINLFLIGYTVYGSVVPGLFWHPGLGWKRVVSSMSVEMTTGVFSHLPQLALTLIGSLYPAVTLFNVVKICAVLFVLMAGVFARPELVLEPGGAQFGAIGLLLAATVAVVFSLNAKFSPRKTIDIPVRLGLAGLGIVVIFHPNTFLTSGAAVLIGLIAVLWFVRQARVQTRVLSSLKSTS